MEVLGSGQMQSFLRHSNGRLGLLLRLLVLPQVLVVRHCFSEIGHGDEVWEGGEEVGPGAVGHWVEPHLYELLLQVGVPEILDLVVCSAREMGSYGRPPAVFIQSPPNSICVPTKSFRKQGDGF